jgi:FMN reductase
VSPREKYSQHEFGSAGGTELDIDTDSDLMRLATGGSAV